MKLKDAFDSIDKDGKAVKLAVKYPSAKQQQKANVVHAATFKEVVSDALFRVQLEEILRKKGIWDDAKQRELEDLQAKLIVNERKLLSGGIKLSEGKAIALQMAADRNKIRQLSTDKASMDGMTVEGQCENARFNYLVSQCTVYNDSGNPYFNSYEDYLDRADEIAARQASLKLMTMLYNFDEDMNAGLPENKFLKDHKFVNDDYHLIDKDGRLVDFGGRLVDNSGRYIDTEGKFVDINGNRVDEEGNFIIEAKPFLDDDGEPIVEGEAKTETPPKKTRKSKVKN